MRKLQVKRTERIYRPEDVFPYGPWKGRPLSEVAKKAWWWLDRWQQNRKVQFSNDLQEAIRLAKFLHQ